MRLGWLQDPETDVIGGAELSTALLRSRAPKGVDVVDVPPGSEMAGLDAYAVFNCTRYNFFPTVQMFGAAPVFKVVYDIWPHGDPKLREWFCHHAARLAFVSPLQREHFVHVVSVPEAMFPPGIDLEPFRAARHPERQGTVWIGQMTGPHKGLEAAMEWARANGPVEFYGAGPRLAGPNVRHHGQVPPAEVPGILGRAERFLHLPAGIDACPRTVLEAWAAECEIVTNENQGATWWVANAPEEIETGVARFWEMLR